MIVLYTDIIINLKWGKLILKKCIPEIGRLQVKQCQVLHPVVCKRTGKKQTSATIASSAFILFSACFAEFSSYTCSQAAVHRTGTKVFCDGEVQRPNFRTLEHIIRLKLDPKEVQKKSNMEPCKSPFFSCRE